jgi:hypothetical protein
MFLLQSTNPPQFSAAILSTAVCVYYFASDVDDRHKMLMIPNVLFWSTTRFDLMVCFTVASALFCVSDSGLGMRLRSLAYDP